MFIALLLATDSSLLSLSSSLISNSAALVNSANVNNILSATPTVVSSSSSSSNSNGQQTSGLLVGSVNPVASTKLTEPQTSSREIEKQIVDKILGEGYDKRIRPAGSGRYNASRPGKYYLHQVMMMSSG